MKYDRELRFIDNQFKAYFLGFMYGDGCITNYKESTGRVRYVTRISIASADKELIDQFSRLFPFLNMRSYDFGKHNSRNGIQYSVTKSSKELFYDLKSNGLYPRKSNENKELLKLPDIDKSLIPHFLRGLFDADGSFYKLKSRQNLIRFEFCSSSYNLVKDVRNHLNNRGIYEWRLRSKDNSKLPIHKLEIIRTDSVIRLIDYLYKDADIFMQRKYDKVKNHRKVNKVTDRSIECPNCKSLNTWKNGDRGPSIRMVCIDCNKGFSVRKDKFQAHVKLGELRGTS